MQEKNKNLTVKEKRREDILLGALKVFCEKGYSGATVNDIVNKAGCSHGLFYHYYKSKKDIFDDVCSFRGKHMIDYMEEQLKELNGYLVKLKNITEFTFNNIKNDEIFAYRYYFFVSTIFAKAVSGELPPKDKKPPYLRMYDFFKDGVMRGEFTDKYPPEECMRLYNSIVQGATLNFILCPKDFKPSFKFPMIDFILDIFKKDGNNGKDN